MSENSDKIEGQPEASEAELTHLFPTGAKYLTKSTPSDSLKNMISQWARNDADLENMFLGALSGIPTMHFDVPEWVKLASRRFLEGSGLKAMCLEESADWTAWMGAVGHGFGAIEDLLHKPDPDPVCQGQKKEILAPMMAEIKTFASNTNAKDSAAFFSARLKGEETRESINQVTVPTKICMLIALNWQGVSKMKSTAELHEFLLEQETTDGQKILPFNVDSRETRRICESIGLRFDNSWNKEKPKI